MKRDPNVIFEGSIPENYDRYLGPALFEPFAKDIAARLKGATQEMREAYRVLTPSGMFLFNVWDSMERNPFGRIAHKTIASFFECDAPNFDELPFGFHDADLIRGLLQRAGFKGIEASLVTLPCHSPSAAEFAIGLARAILSQRQFKSAA